MNCQKVQEMFSPWLDGQLDSSKELELQAHLKTCAYCRDEWHKYRQISQALRLIGQDVMAAPPGFSAAVMGRIKEDRAISRVSRRQLLKNWKKPVAGLAAAFMLFFSSIYLWPDNIGSIADNNDNSQTNRPSVTDVTEPMPAPALNNTNDTEKIHADNLPENEAPVNIAENNSPDEVNPPVVQEQPEAENNNSFIIANNNSTDDTLPQLLSNKKVISSLALKVDVETSAAAQNQAHDFTTQLGGTFESLGQKTEGDTVYLISKITVPVAKSDLLISKLARLGIEVDRQINKQDITAQYSEAEQQLNILQNKADADEQQISFLQTQLDTWNQELANMTIVLWLQ